MQNNTCRRKTLQLLATHKTAQVTHCTVQHIYSTASVINGKNWHALTDVRWQASLSVSNAKHTRH